MPDTITPEPGFEPDRILTEQGRWVHINRPVDAPFGDVREEGITKVTAGNLSVEYGPTLRDRFAMSVLPAIVTATSAGQHQPRHHDDAETSLIQAMCRNAYEIADAMMAERERAK